MTSWSRLLAVLVALPALAGGGAGGQPPTKDTPAEPAQGRKLALLVGCTKYDHLGKRFQLRGPGNDVVLMRKVLRESLGFADADIVTLAEGAAAGRPTRANIQREFERLAKTARPGDQIVILLGGHGSQQPDQEPFDEVDGLDETFLPCDAGPWDGGKEVVTNAIIDDELAVWTKAITDRGASLWMVVDACHSGTVLRGGDEVAREIPAEDLVPAEALRKAAKQAAERREAARGTPAAEPAEQSPRLAALYAAQPHEPTVERPMPPDGDGDERYGLLTYTLCQILTRARTPLTYRELGQRIQAQYVQWGRTNPTPLVEGLGQDREVLGTRSWPGRSQFTLAHSEGGAWKVQGGQLHGLTDGSVLAVHPPAGQPDKVLGHVRVRKSLPAEAEVEPCAHEGTPAPKELVEGGRCVPVYLDLGSLRLRVAVEEGEGHERLRQQLEKIAQAPNSLVELAADTRRADVVAQLRAGQVYLLPVDAAQLKGEPPPGTPRFGPFAPEEADRLGESLARIARARNLLRLAAPPGGTADASAAAELEVSMLKLKDKNDRDGTKVAWGPEGVVLAAGDWVAWRVKNRGRTALDISLLFIDSGYGVHAVFPRPGTVADNRLAPGETYMTRPGRVNAKTVGLEHLLVIAVKGEGQPVDFTCLAQPTLEQAQQVATRGGGGKQALGSPLGQVLQNALYARGTARGWDEDQVDAQVLRLLSWQTRPTTKAEK